jgi:outer membrane protein TolC
MGTANVKSKMKTNWIVVAGLLGTIVVASGGFVCPALAQSEAPLAPRPRAGTVPAPAAEASWQGAALENPFLGSVPSGEVSAGEIALSLTDAIQRGLKYNLGQLLARQTSRGAEGERWQARSALLPLVTTQTFETVQETNLAAVGFTGFPGLQNTILGPFGVFDTRIFFSQPVFNWSALSAARAGSENSKAANFSYENARNDVVTVVASLYLGAVAGASRIEAVQAELNTAQALYQQASNFKQAGVVPAIEVLRAQVELQARRQQLIFYQNEFEKQKLSLARSIGLPERQPFRLSDQLPYVPLPPMTLAESLARAYRERSDFQSALASVRASEQAKKAAEGGRLPTVSVSADFGDIGARVGSSHETFSATASLRIPLFQGGRVRGEILEASALLERQKAQLEDLRSRIEHEVRIAFLDLNASGERVEVSRNALDLAQQELDQARDRFAAGVTGNIEVVQAQESLAAARENYIASTYAYNLAKTSLARALGGAERSFRQFLLGETP